MQATKAEAEPLTADDIQLVLLMESWEPFIVNLQIMWLSWFNIAQGKFGGDPSPAHASFQGWAQFPHKCLIESTQTVQQASQANKY